MKNSEDADRVGKRGEAKHRRCPLVEILEWGIWRMQITLGRGERPNVGFRAIMCKTIDPQSMCRFVRTLRVLIGIF